MASKRHTKKEIKKAIQRLESILFDMDLSLEFMILHNHLKKLRLALNVLKNL